MDEECPVERRTYHLLARRPWPGLLAAAVGLLLAGPAAAEPPPAAGTPLFPDEARKAALEKTAVALRLEIEEQGAAAPLAYREALATEPRLVAVQRAAGNHLAWLGQWEAAAAAYGAITRLDPYSPEGYALLGEALVQQGQVSGIEPIQKALEMDARAASARLPLARLARAAGDRARQAQILDGIAAEDRDQPVVVLERASLHLQQGEDEQAEKLLGGLVAGHDDAGLPLTVAELWLAHGRCGKAVPMLQQEATVRPRAESLRSLGWGLLVCGREPIRAAGAFTAALQRDNGDDGARVGLAWSLLALDRPGEPLDLANRWCDEVLRRNPSQPAALLALAEVHRRKGEASQAVAALDRLPAGHPAVDEADNLRARLAIEREDPYAAIDILRKLTERRPDLLHVRLNLAEGYIRAGRSREAREVVRTVSGLVPAGHPLLAHAERLLSSPRSQR